MISFRFQVVALASITLALGVGLVVGHVGGKGPAAPPVRPQPNTVDQRTEQLQTQLNQLANATKQRSDLATGVAPAILDHRLSGVSVLVVTTPAGDAFAPGVARMLTLAGATQTGRLRLTDAFTDPQRSAELLDLAKAALPPSDHAGLPATSDGVLAASSLLAQALLEQDDPITDDDRRSVLAAYTGQGFLTATAPVTAASDAIILLTGPAASGAEAVARTGAVLTFVAQVSAIGPLVVAADGVEATVVGRIRADHTLAANVSTVDNAATVPGQLIAVWALVDALAGRTGQFGDAPGATALPPLLPVPPAPSGSPSVSPSPTAPVG